ncbi:hypothetical protein CPELA_11050 [Corynebacterium pelargi]|uniref:Uncharacterized protein n=1 Tax=Corynebacterium pelargi TaxID=1471400 RepID=A0A410WBX8_9CORY|nr:hypothetical protein CPELA_11050 [Corynebacterium pelargi]
MHRIRSRCPMHWARPLGVFLLLERLFYPRNSSGVISLLWGQKLAFRRPAPNLRPRHHLNIFDFKRFTLGDAFKPHQHLGGLGVLAQLHAAAAASDLTITQQHG